MPTVQRVHLDKALTNISIGYTNGQFIADQIFKPIPVDKQSDKYYVFGKERFRQHADLRAPGDEANEINWTLSDDQYFCEGHALRHPIADEELQNADDAFDLQTEATELVTEGILLNKEVDASSKVRNPANYDADLVIELGVGGAPAKWSSYSSTTPTESNPILDVKRAKEAIHRKSGIRANTLILSETVFNVLSMHPALIEVIKYVQRGIVTAELMAAAFGVDQILVGSAQKSLATNPADEDVLDYIWGNDAILAYIPERPGRKTPALGYSFMWNKDGQGPIQVRQWYEIGRRATIVEAERWYDQKIVSSVAGFLFKNAVDPIGEF